MKAAEFFKVATSAVLMNSNVVERGMDFPGCVSSVSFMAFDLHCRNSVTLAIEVGELIDVLLLKEGSVGGAGEEEFS